MRRTLTGVAALVGLALLGSVPAAAQDRGRQHGWADEVKRSLDKPDRESGEMTGSTAAGSRESQRPQSSQRPAKGQGSDKARF
ncbi:hypothetical protein [Salinarimonas soli]|uniref:Uncharacterized protein n=1 Tax=Salinarimonas soli TaxID=1638099 RepID=A0A5B2V8T9_9HYPH|nr:hypothetical protein [Salinarimonas soli]KAA2235226.1 hypothetical protein F0L46_21005 [Salinarimonas soli]